MVNPWVVPVQKPHPPIWFPGTGSPESVYWAARNGYPYMNLGALLHITEWLRDTYVEVAKEYGFRAGPEHFGYLIRVFCADTDEKAKEVGRNFMWTSAHKGRGPREHNDPPGYQTREAMALKADRQAMGGGFNDQVGYEDLLELDNIIVGSPDTVIRKLRMVIERLNPGYIHIYGNDGPMPQEDVLRSIELLGAEVIPALKEIQLKPFL